MRRQPDRSICCACKGLASDAGCTQPCGISRFAGKRSIAGKGELAAGCPLRTLKHDAAHTVGIGRVLHAVEHYLRHGTLAGIAFACRLVMYRHRHASLRAGVIGIAAAKGEARCYRSRIPHIGSRASKVWAPTALFIGARAGLKPWSVFKIIECRSGKALTGNFERHRHGRRGLFHRVFAESAAGTESGNGNDSTNQRKPTDQRAATLDAPEAHFFHTLCKGGNLGKGGDLAHQGSLAPADWTVAREESAVPAWDAHCGKDKYCGLAGAGVRAAHRHGMNRETGAPARRTERRQAGREAGAIPALPPQL